MKGAVEIGEVPLLILILLVLAFFLKLQGTLKNTQKTALVFVSCNIEVFIATSYTV